MKKIKLTQGKVAFVDDESYQRIKSLSYQFSTTGYAQRKNPLKNGVLYMHNDILGFKKGKEIDHINGNKLDNCKDNLRFVTRSQNGMNQKKRQKSASSKFKGVSFNKAMKKWEVYINKNGKRFKLGYWSNEKVAAELYNQKAKELFGDFARLNVYD